jgi:hypothetical protein
MSPLEKKGFLGSSIEDWIRKIRTKHANFFALTDNINEEAQKFLFELQPHSKHVQELLIVSLYLRSLSTYQATLLLVERGMMPEARLMLRGLLEVLFFLCAIGKKPDLAKDYVEEHQQYRLKLLRKFKELHGATFPLDIGLEDVKSLEEELKAEIGAGKFTVRTTEQWAQEAGLHEWYLSVYAILSITAHIKVKDLERYLVTDKSGEIRGIKWGPDDHDVKNIFITAAESMLIAMKSASEVFQINKDDIINNLHAELEKIAAESSDK